MLLKHLSKSLMTALMIATCLSLAVPANAAENETTQPEKKTGEQSGEDTYSKQEIKEAVEGFFASTSKSLAELIERAFAEQGRPNGYITGNEGGGALVVGLRYGEGTLHLKNKGTAKVYWQGPSAGFDIGGNIAKAFVLVYDMKSKDQIYQRFPGVDGSAYVVGGFSMNYARAAGITLAPIRTGVGLRLGINVGYLAFTREQTINPF